MDDLKNLRQLVLNSGVFGEALPVRNFQRVSLLDVKLKAPGVYVLDLDFLEPASRLRVAAYAGAHFEVRVGVRNASKILRLAPGVHAVVADTLQITAIGATVGMAVFNWVAIASGAPAEVLPQWTEVP